MSARWLVDTSALMRIGEPDVAAVLAPRIDAGHVAIALVTELELGFSARSLDDHERTRRLLDQLVPVVMPARAERIAREVQQGLVEVGQHRAIGLADLLVAAIAEASGMTLVHHDRDFDRVAALTGQPTEWVVGPPNAARETDP